MIVGLGFGVFCFFFLQVFCLCPKADAVFAKKKLKLYMKIILSLASHRLL